jgi:hypothetical protein
MKYLLFGLQRTGTNVIKDYIQYNFNIKMFNTKHPDRNSVLHKHYRPYKDKKYILNEVTCKIFFEKPLDLINFLEKNIKDKIKIIIAKKDIFSWLISIKKMVKQCNWKNITKNKLINDYKLFYDFWGIHQDNVLLIDYNDFLLNNNEFKKKLQNFIEKKFLNKKIPQKVKYSNKFNKSNYNYYIQKKYMNKYSDDQIEEINRYFE